jgi:DNA (cytosine-5)-methyltransferase 1
MGYHRAGFDVVGVDIKPQPHYPFKFIQADALSLDLEFLRQFDAIHASPPCQAYCALRHLLTDDGQLFPRTYPDLVVKTRDLLVASGKPYVIENVPKAPLINPIMLCGSSFGLKVRRHRLFETPISLSSLSCNHKEQGRPIDVSGTGGRRINRRPDDHGGNTNKPRNLAEAQGAIGIDWMKRYELSQAIPPAYTEFIGAELMRAIMEVK